MFLFCAAFLMAGGGVGGGGGGSYTLYLAVFVVLLWLAFLSVCLFFVCFLGLDHMSQPVAM